MIDESIGINFGFDNGKFFVEYYPTSRPVGNFRQEFEKRAADLYEKFPNLMLGLSSGIDSQAVLHSFHSQGIDIECAFLYQPGFNDVEYQQLKIIEKKYNIKSDIVEIDPIKNKDEIVHLHQELHLPLNQIIHRKFLSMLPEDKNFIQGFPGPDFYLKNNKWYWLETANSWDVSRLRSLLTLERKGHVIGFERTSEILLSLLTDETVKSYIYSFEYIKQNGLMMEDGSTISFAYHWDLYIKPFFYGKLWKDKLEYFPKSQGCENIDYIINGPKNQYLKNLVAIPYYELIDFLKTKDSEKRRFYEYQ
jgi:hypothetical protein